LQRSQSTADSFFGERSRCRSSPFAPIHEMGHLYPHQAKD
jgi:hypothetical protein